MHYHVPERRPLADVLTCVREKCTMAEAGLRLSVNAERHLKSPAEMAQLFARFPGSDRPHDRDRQGLQLLARPAPIRTSRRAGALRQNLAQRHLEDLTRAGAQERYPQDKYPDGIPDDVQERLKDELALIAKLDYARYFLTVHDVVHYARRQDKEILFQGRASAANSAVCYCLGITSVNPEKTKLPVRPLHFR